jgi:hypothetical protein
MHWQKGIVPGSSQQPKWVLVYRALCPGGQFRSNSDNLALFEMQIEPPQTHCAGGVAQHDQKPL